MHLTTPFTAVLGLLIAAGAASPIQKDKVSIPADVSDDHSSAMTVPIVSRKPAASCRYRHKTYEKLL
ncbi:hypothetical protein CCUS01_07371 [Colletotrichum cuscutae]|uniref:Uncharacterized protein n=1 Tax=Colletotrichum cuscutae TaxID=1209917 RepID=A0AAI9UXD3_9PEZI|nr:hypothetical protein CCUS01_07371 [Colletotrichum cuscutae]